VLVAPAVLVVVGWATTIYLDRKTEGMSGGQAYEYLWGHHWSAVLARSLLAQADLFGYGMLAAVVVIALARRGITRVPPAVPAVLLLTVVALIWAALGGPLESNSRRFMGMAAAVLVLAVVLPSGSGGANGVARTLEARPLRYLGLISYSVYLWHVPVLFWLDRHGLSFGRGPGGLAANIVWVTVVTLVLSTLTFWLVERPALNAKKRTGPPPAEQRDESTGPVAPYAAAESGSTPR
jgi:peptidoglycan/LPS O-acetylase OafA/YrhL